MAAARRNEPATQRKQRLAKRPAREAEYAARWREGAWLGQTLTTLEGERYTLLYQGRPGTGTGPDFRDAVLLTSNGERLCGDVELHLRPRNWQAHGHDRDHRYNHVALHVVIAPGSDHERATLRQDGSLAPITVLPLESSPPPRTSPWPCHSLGASRYPEGLANLLRALGEARLHERAVALGVAIHTTPALLSGVLSWSSGDVTLWLALSEALGYGRDRDAMRAAGWRLLGDALVERGAPPLALRVPPLPAGDGVRGWGPQPPREHSEDFRSEVHPFLDARRLDGLACWLERWRDDGPWRELEALLRSGSDRVAAREVPRALAAASGGAISPSRAAILVVNVVLPFALAVAGRTDDLDLERRVHAIYAAKPGLPSNTITRVLARQLGLARLPSGAQAQQGLHHVWAHWCREKRCDSCPLASLGRGVTIVARAGS